MFLSPSGIVSLDIIAESSSIQVIKLLKIKQNADKERLKKSLFQNVHLSLIMANNKNTLV